MDRSRAEALLNHLSGQRRIASRTDDPFHPGVVAFVRKLGPDATVDIRAGCHDTDSCTSQQQRWLQFISRHLSTTRSY